ncbi:MAG TPA: hypothetical protein PKA27_12205 [Fimbriimonadaceae bacterium]|nr:hypothetical protein [Fimbriimonadaceae bacterium]
MKVRGCWGGTGECGSTTDGVARYLDRLVASGINQVFMGIKEGDGRLCWPSSVHPDAVKPEYEAFDLPMVLCEEGAKRGIAVHGWLIDYYEGEHSPAYTKHPEWAALDPNGRPSAECTLRGRRYDAVWMCPARPNGYTDEWLVPIYRELAERYPLASIHHDYIRYPGDLAPDTYCFCDYCLDAIPKFAGYINEAYPSEPFHHELYDRPFLESHWEQSPRVLPVQWERLPRHMKADFLLNGSFFGMGRQDLDYFFYLYRIHHINEFARKSAEAVRAVNPTTKLSGAIFKNPVHSGRFIGQDWRNFIPWMDIAVPMDYRDHFPGSFENYLALLKETIERQKIWAGPMDLWIGIAANFLFKEEHESGVAIRKDKVAETLHAIDSTGVDGAVIFCSDQLSHFGLWDVVREAWS